MNEISRYRVMESFYSLQGEGFHQGKAAYFIRLGGCDVGCVWCDVKESWEYDFPGEEIPAMVKKASKHASRIAIITGGEPLLQDLDPLTTHLRSQGFRTHLETAGAHPLSGVWDWVCLSPKKFKEPLDANLVQANELKVVVFNKSDLEWAQSFQHKVGSHCHLYLQPEWSRRESMVPTIIKFIKSNPDWEISLQTHKFMDIP